MKDGERDALLTLSGQTGIEAGDTIGVHQMRHSKHWLRCATIKELKIVKF